MIYLVRPDSHRSVRALIVQKLIDLKAVFKSADLNECTIKLLSKLTSYGVSFAFQKPQYSRTMFSKGNLI